MISKVINKLECIAEGFKEHYELLLLLRCLKLIELSFIVGWGFFNEFHLIRTVLTSLNWLLKMINFDYY